MLSSIILCNCTKEICNSRILATLTLTTTFDYRSGLSWALKVYRCILDYEERAIIVFLIFKLIANSPFQIACEYAAMLGDGTANTDHSLLGNGGTLTILNSWNLPHSALSDQAKQPLFEGVAKSYSSIVRKWAQKASQIITFFSVCELGKYLNMWKELSIWLDEYCAWPLLKFIFRKKKKHANAALV